MLWCENPSPLLAEAYGRAGQPVAGSQALVEALALVAATELPV